MSGSRGARESLDAGRETLGIMLRSAQKQLQKVFILFLLGLVATIYVMRRFGWEVLKGVTSARMSEATASEFDVIVRTPFDVILLQVKLGLIVGILVAAPLLAYYTREALIERDRWPFDLSRTMAATLLLLSLSLFAAGIAYAYFVFFPVAFNFLTKYTLNVGFQPKYDVVKWTQFILLLTISFGLAAQLPLVMSGLSYSGVVPYEYFREKWRHATVLIFAFGALFSPPDPFTQLMWGVPLLVLYGFSLYLTKLVTAVKRGGQTMVRAKLRRNWTHIAGPTGLVAAGSTLLFEAGALPWVESNVLPAVPAAYRPAGLSTAPVPGTGLVEAAIAGLAIAAVVAVPLVLYYAWPELQPRGSTGDPYDIDLSNLDAEGVQAAPIQAFADLSEEEAVSAAREAMDRDAPEKAEAILERFDEAQEHAEEEDRTEPTAEPTGEDRSVGEVATDTTAGMLNSFTDEDTDEEELGGYAYDLAFILESLTSKSFRVVAVFMGTVLLTFFWLYGGAFKALRADFFSRLPAQVVEDVDIVALHPVEALLFEVKMSLIAGLIVVLPAILYYAWPAVESRLYGVSHEYETPAPLGAVRQRWNKVAAVALLAAAATYVLLTAEASGLPVAAPTSPVAVAGFSLSATTATYLLAAAGGLVGAVPVGAYYAWPSMRDRWTGESNREAFLLWGGTLVGGVVVGSLLGYAYIAPPIISYLVYDAVQAGMVVRYTINDFFWLVFVTTAGIGLLADVPLTMWLFHYTGIVSYETMRQRWRGIVFVVFVAAAVFTSRSVMTMFLFGVPVTFMYWFGLAGLWAGTLPGRVRSRVAGEPS